MQTAKEMVVMTPCKRCEEGASNVHILCIFYAHATRQSLVVLFPVAPRQIIYQHFNRNGKNQAPQKVGCPSCLSTDRLFEVPTDQTQVQMLMWTRKLKNEGLG